MIKTQALNNKRSIFLSYLSNYSKVQTKETKKAALKKAALYKKIEVLN